MIGILNDAVQLRRWDAVPPLSRHRQRCGQHLLYTLLRQRADEKHRHVVKKLQIRAHLARIFYHRLRVFLDNVPLVHQDDDALVRLQHVARDVRVLRGNPLDTVDEKQGHVCSIDAAHAAKYAVFLYPRLYPPPPSDSRRVNQGDSLTMVDNLSINGIARRAGDFTYNCPFVPDQRVEQTALPYIRSPHKRDGNDIFLPLIPNQTVR